MNVYLVCFDIADDTIRKRVGDELLAHGERVQKSVFEIPVRRPEDVAALRAKLAAWLESGDDLRFYRLCAECRAQSRDARGEGLARFPAATVL